MGQLDEIVQRIMGMDPKARAALIKEARQRTAHMVFVPNPGPQTLAYLSKADLLLYGGQAGGGKSFLELGYCINDAHNAIIFRRERTQTDGLEKDGKALIGGNARFNGQDLEWSWPDGRSLKLAGMQLPDDWRSHAGRERDAMCFDEAGEFLEQQVASILAWLRAPKKRRCRVIFGSNPPRTSDGFWLVKWFAPWLDESFPDPAEPGELRWACRVMKGNDIIMQWVPGPGTYTYEGEKYIAQSYTFIPASLEDNPYRNTDQYKAQLQSLPEPLRSQLLYGKFATSLRDLENQCIPSEWVRLAQTRWRLNPKPPVGVPMCAMGVDCAGGGADSMVIAPRYDGWFAPLVKEPGSNIPMVKAGAHAAGLVLRERRDGALVVVDMSGGYGGPLYEKLNENNIDCVAYKGAEKSTRRSRDGKLGFTNKRSAAYWWLREALDPGQPGGSPIFLPEDRRLFAGLTAPTFAITPRGIQVEPKVVRDDKGRVTAGVMHKLGFSPDEADAVVMGWYEGARHATHAMDWMDNEGQGYNVKRNPQVVAAGGRQPLSTRFKR
jgi:hypothetical protein